MEFKNDKYLWTHHVRDKMRYYKLTEARIKRIIRHPTRIEEGILDEAIACMQPAEGKNYSEIWAMYLIVPQDGFLGSSSRRHAKSFLLKENPCEILNARTSGGRLAKFPAKAVLWPQREIFLRTRSRSFAFGKNHARETSSWSAQGTASTVPDSTYGFKRLKIITAWRYPGKSPARDPIPAEVLREIKNLI